MMRNFFKQVVLSIYGFFGFKGLEKKRATEVLDKFKDKKVYGQTSNANFFGQESLGAAKVRGNGVLVLAEGVLYFEMWVPGRELSIPFSSITGVETPKVFLGKTKGKALLKVCFKNQSGNADSAAWLLNNLTHWQSAIEKIVTQNKT
ncbi:MAG: hypothetical protein V1739_05165 [Candidatus Omnitrophota bacterium]